MKLVVRLPSGNTVDLEDVPTLEALKRRIESATGIPVALQEVRLTDVPLEALPRDENVTLDLVVRVGREYAIASAEIPALPGVETFRPARSIERMRDFEKFRSVSHLCRFSDGRPLAKTADISDAQRRASAQVEPYRAAATARRARLKELCVDLDGPLVAMTFNAPYAQLFENWDRSCHENGIDVRGRTIVFPMGPRADEVAKRLGYLTFVDESYGDFRQSPDVRFGDRQWVNCLFMKNAVMGDMLEVGVDVLFQDADVIWRRDPLPYLQAKASLEGWDFMFQQAGINPIFQPLYYNSGFVYARSNDFSRLTWERVLDNHVYCHVYRSQQAPLNVIMNTFRERGLRTCGLEESLFVNGHLIPAKAERNAGPLHPQAFMIHFNWTDGLATKLDRLRDYGLWFLDGGGSTVPSPSPCPSPSPERRGHIADSGSGRGSGSGGRDSRRHSDHALCWVSDRLRCIYVAIAKNASSTIKAELRRLDPNVRSARCTEIATNVWRDYTTFVFLRDPASRVLSAYQEVSMRLEGKTDDSLPFTKLPEGAARFDAFLDRIEAGAWDGHVRSQVDSIGDHQVDFWGRVESFQSDFTRLLERLGINSGPSLPQRRSRIGRARDYGYSSHLLWETDLTPETSERIRTIYAEDLKLLATIQADANPPERASPTTWTPPVVRRPPR